VKIKKFRGSIPYNGLKSVAHKWNGKKSLLVLRHNSVGSAVVLLIENVLVIAHIL
jgi:hypothetical protein